MLRAVYDLSECRDLQVILSLDSRQVPEWAKFPSMHDFVRYSYNVWVVARNAFRGPPNSTPVRKDKITSEKKITPMVPETSSIC